MVDVAAIFDDVFGHADQDKGASKKGCARCVGVSRGGRPLETKDIPGTPKGNCGHTSNQGVPETGQGCVRDIVENQAITSAGTRAHRAHRAHLFSDNPSYSVDLDAFEERAGIIEHDGGLPRQEAETLAAQEQGCAAAASLHSEVVGFWAAEIERLARLEAVGPGGAKALKRA